MKPFDLEAAKNGAKVCTRDGRPVRIVCYDRKSEGYPILALVTLSDNAECPVLYTEKGKCYPYGDHKDDLFLASTKREGWVNVYKDGDGYYFGELEETRDRAIERSCCNRVDTIHIEWKE